MRWPDRGPNSNPIPHLGDDQLEALVRDPEEEDGERLRTRADRLRIEGKSLAAIEAADRGGAHAPGAAAIRLN